MTTAYYFTAARPPDARRDAILKEAALLQAEHPGPSRFLGTGGGLARRLPAAWRAARRRPLIEALDSAVDTHHLFTDDLGWCALFRGARKPLLVSLTTPLGGRTPRPPAPRPFAVAVRLAPDASRLRDAGWRRVVHAPAGAHLPSAPLPPPPPGPPWTVLFASAPWTQRQFRTKGVDALLAAARQRPDLRLILLWRGVLEGAVRDRIDRSRLTDRVELLLDHVDVEAVLARCHAAVLCPTRRRVVTPHPHSLLESLASGRPVVLSRPLGLAPTIESAGAGVVLDAVSGTTLAGAFDRLFASYDGYRRGALSLDCSPWGAPAYIEVFRALRAELAATAGASNRAATAPRNLSRP